MREAPTLAAMARSPDGSFLRGRGWLTFCARAQDPAVWGFSVWGGVTGADAHSLVAALALELSDDVAPHRSLIDARGLTAVDPESFQALSAYVTDHHEALGRAVTGLAIVRPPGLEGAVVAGFFQVLPPPYAVHVVDTIDAGLTALGVGTSPEIDALLTMLQTVTDTDAIDDVIRRLSALCARDHHLELPAAAVAMGLSERSLQRRLREAGTTFSDVAAAVRWQQARLAIEGSDVSLTTIALDAGYASLQHLGVACRKATGLSPSRLRAAARAALS